MVPNLSPAAPSMQIEPAYQLPNNTGSADFPESGWTGAARHAMFSRNDYATAQSYDYAAVAPHFVTWDYASPFLYARPAVTPYPYVLIEG